MWGNSPVITVVSGKLYFLNDLCFSFLFRQFFTSILSLSLFLLSINITSPLPMTDKEVHDVTTADPADGNRMGAATGQNNASRHDFSYGETRNTNTNVHYGRKRRSAGCIKSKTTVQCGKHLIATVTCKRRSLVCSGNGRVAPRCVPKKYYFPVCQKVFTIDCKCA